MATCDMRKAMAALVLFLAGGCGTFVSSTMINPAPWPMVPRAPEAVELYASSPPSRPHVDVAVLECQQTHSLNEEGTALMIRTLRERAGAMGCDAVFLGNVTDHQGSDAIFDPASTIRQATCVVYTDVPPPAVAPPAVSTAPAAPRPPPTPSTESSGPFHAPGLRTGP
jgi:hypothetical protein